jgi:putative ABC transport system permease protein
MTGRLSLLRHEVAAVMASMRRSPYVPLVAIGMLTLAIGVNIAVFTVISRTLLRPLRYASPDRLLVIVTSHIQPDHTEVDEPSNDREAVQWKVRSTLFQDVEAIKPLSMTLTGTGDPESVRGGFVTGSFFGLFGVRPLIGRDFNPEENVPQPQSTILSYGLWQRRFGASRSVLGRSITVDGRRLMVAGVMPRTFEIPGVAVDLYIPEGLGPANTPNPRQFNYTVYGRLREGVTAAQGRAELRRISKQLEHDYPDSEKNKSATVKTFRDSMFGDRKNAFVILWLAVALVQALACVNVANLIIARSNDQRGVTALRLVLGASRVQLMRLRLIEGLLISTAASILGYALGIAAVHFTVGGQPDLGTPVESGWTIALFVIVTAMFTAIVVTVVPALRECGVGLSTVLNEGSQRASSSVRGTRAREMFVGVQVALAVPLLLAAVSAVSRFRDLQRVDLGFDADHVLTAQFIMPPRYDRNARTTFERELLRRLSAAPGVTSAAVTTNLFQRGQTAGTFAATDRFPELVSMSVRLISPGYFDTMKIPLRRGRPFTEQDLSDSPPVAIVSEALAKRFWPGEDPIGKRIHRSPPNPWMTVVGIAPDVHDEGISQEAGPTLYTPYAQKNGIYLSLVVRTIGDPLSMRDSVRRAVWSLDRKLTPSEEKPLRQLMDATVDPERLQATLLSAFAVVAFLLAAVGIYAATAYAVSQRTREIGVRLAFGATPKTISLEVLRQTARCAGLGLIAGLGIAFAAEKIRLFVAYGAAAFDVRLAATICALIFATSLLAGFIPSLRSRSVMPSMLLRDV